MFSMRRREFLVGGCVAAGASLAAAARGEKSNAAPPTIGLGFSLYGMMMLKIDEALSACADIGYDCVELPVTPGWEGDSLDLDSLQRKRIRKKLAATGLRLSALMENLHVAVDDQRHRSNLQRLKAAGQLAHDLAPAAPPVIETVLGGRPADWEKRKQRMVERLRDWAKVAEATETVVAIKAHVGGAMHLPKHPVWLAAQVDSRWIRCAYDYSHFELRGVDMAQSVKTLVPHSAFIHVKDSRGQPGNVQFLLPGDGKIDYETLLKLIVAAGYQGDVFVEVSGQIHRKAGYRPLDAARRSYAHLAPAFERAGVPRG